MDPRKAVLVGIYPGDPGIVAPVKVHSAVLETGYIKLIQFNAIALPGQDPVGHISVKPSRSGEPELLNGQKVAAVSHQSLRCHPIQGGNPLPVGRNGYPLLFCTAVLCCQANGTGEYPSALEKDPIARGQVSLIEGPH